MKKMILNIFRAVLLYLAFVIISDAILAIIIEEFNMNAFGNTMISLLCNSFQPDSKILIQVALDAKNLFEGITFAILTSAVFIYVVNREVNIVFPEKLVLRRRTSEGSEGMLTLSAMIGNPERKWLYHVCCTMNCIYSKDSDNVSCVNNRVPTNNETYLHQDVEIFQNYYRFSFDVDRIPKTFWDNYSKWIDANPSISSGNERPIILKSVLQVLFKKKPKDNPKDALIVMIEGKTKGLNGDFRVIKRYGFQDIVVAPNDLDESNKSFETRKRSAFTGKEKVEIKWKKFAWYPYTKTDWQNHIPMSESDAMRGIKKSCSKCDNEVCINS